MAGTNRRRRVMTVLLAGVVLLLSLTAGSCKDLIPSSSSSKKNQAANPGHWNCDNNVQRETGNAKDKYCDSLEKKGGGNSGSGNSGSGSNEKVDCFRTYSASQCNNMKLGRVMCRDFFGTDRYWPSLRLLWHGESGWSTNATGAKTNLGRAYGIPQSLPRDKMAKAGGDWRTSPKTQIKWGLDYIKRRYGNPDNAYSSWNNRDPHWY